MEPVLPTSPFVGVGSLSFKTVRELATKSEMFGPRLIWGL
jgi:hypothetical protein